MMNKRLLLIFVLVACAIATLLGLSLLKSGPGYVWISYADYSIETTFWLFCASLVAVTFLLWLSYRLFWLSISVLKNFGLISRHWGVSKAQQQLSNFRLAFADGQNDKAIQAFKKSKKALHTQADWVMAARLAIEAGQLQDAADFIQALKSRDDYNELSATLLELDLAIKENNTGKIAAILPKLLREFPKELIVKEKALAYYQSIGDAKNLSQVLDSMPRSWKKKNGKLIKEMEDLFVEQASHLDSLKPLLKNLHQRSEQFQCKAVQQAALYDTKLAMKLIDGLFKHDAFAVVSLAPILKLQSEQVDSWIHLLEQRSALSNHASAKVLVGAAYLYDQSGRHNKASDLYHQALERDFDLSTYKLWVQTLKAHKSDGEIAAIVANF